MFIIIANVETITSRSSAGYLRHLLRADRLTVPPGAGLPNAPAPKPPAAGAGLPKRPPPPAGAAPPNADVAGAPNDGVAGAGAPNKPPPPAAGVDAGAEAPNRPPPPAAGVDAAGAPNRPPPPAAGVDAAGAPNRPPPLAGVDAGAEAPNSPPPAAGAGLAGAPKRPPPAAGAGLAGAPKPPVNSGERSNDVGQRDVLVRRRERGARACKERTESESVGGKGNIINSTRVDPRDGRGVMYAPNAGVAGVAGVAGAPNMSARDPSRRFNPACVWRAAPTTLARTTQRSRLFPLPPRSHHRVCSKTGSTPGLLERGIARCAPVCTPDLERLKIVRDNFTRMRVQSMIGTTAPTQKMTVCFCFIMPDGRAQISYQGSDSRMTVYSCI